MRLRGRGRRQEQRPRQHLFVGREGSGYHVRTCDASLKKPHHKNAGTMILPVTAGCGRGRHRLLEGGGGVQGEKTASEGD